MVVEGLSPGVENRQTAGLYSQKGRVQGSPLYCFCGTFKEQAVTEPLIDVEQWPEKLRNRKHCVEVSDGKQSALELFHPKLLLDVLALRTVAVTATVVADFDLTAGITA